MLIMLERSLMTIKRCTFILLGCTLLLGCKGTGNRGQQAEREMQFVSMIQNLIYYDAIKIKDVKVSDSGKQSLYLSQNIKRTKIVIYLPELGCASCYEMQLQFLQSTIPSDIKPEVFIVGKFSSYREQKLFEEKSGFTTYRIEKSLTGFPLSMFDETPVTFLLGENMIGYAFFDSSKSNTLSDLYYKFVIEKVRYSMPKSYR